METTAQVGAVLELQLTKAAFACLPPFLPEVADCEHAICPLVVASHSVISSKLVSATVLQASPARCTASAPSAAATAGCWA